MIAHIAFAWAIIQATIEYLRDLLQPLKTALVAWWEQAQSLGGMLKIVLVDLPIALFLVFNQPFIAAGGLAAWVGLTHRRMRPIESAAIGVLAFAAGMWMLNWVAELVVVVTMLCVWDGRRRLVAAIDERLRQTDVPVDYVPWQCLKQLA